MGYLSQAAIFLIDLVLGLFLLAVLLRFLLQRVGADFYNPISQMLYTVTNPVLQPLRRIVPGFQGIDWASILLLFFSSRRRIGSEGHAWRWASSSVAWVHCYNYG